MKGNSTFYLIIHIKESVIILLNIKSIKRIIIGGSILTKKKVRVFLTNENLFNMF